SPKPIQQPRPPIWVSGRQDAAIRRAARYGDGWMPYLYTPEKLAESMDKVGSFAAEVDRPADAIEGGIYLFTCVNEDRDTALELANEQLSLQYNQDFSNLVGKYALAGSPADCIERLNQYIDAGARTIILAHGCPKRYVDDNRAAIAEGLLPAYR
ncbi:MAG: LLM class flavin-dependent oxidoreductase, partial [Actinomycetota bacterium]